MRVRRLASLLPLCLVAGAAPGVRAQAPAAIDTALVAQERSLYEALRRHDPAAFNQALGADFVFVDGSGAMRWQRSMTAGVLQRCRMGRFAMSDVQTTRVADVTVVTFTWTGDETCNGRPSPSPVRVMSVWTRQRGRWVAVSHSETPVTAPVH